MDLRSLRCEGSIIAPGVGGGGVSAGPSEVGSAGRARRRQESTTYFRPAESEKGARRRDRLMRGRVLGESGGGGKGQG